MNTKKIGWAILMGTALLLWGTLPGFAMVGVGGPVGFQGQAPVGFEGNPPVGFEGNPPVGSDGRPTFQGHPGFHGRHEFGCQGSQSHHPYAKECQGGWSHE